MLTRSITDSFSHLVGASVYLVSGLTETHAFWISVEKEFSERRSDSPEVH